MALKTEKYRKYYLKCSNTFLAGCISENCHHKCSKKSIPLSQRVSLKWFSFLRNVIKLVAFRLSVFNIVLELHSGILAFPESLSLKVSVDTLYQFSSFAERIGIRFWQPYEQQFTFLLHQNENEYSNHVLSIGYIFSSTTL